MIIWCFALGYDRIGSGGQEEGVQDAAPLFLDNHPPDGLEAFQSTRKRMNNDSFKIFK